MKEFNEIHGYNKKYWVCPTEEDKRHDVIFGAKKHLQIGMFDMVYLAEKELHDVYGMSYDDIENAIYA